VNLTREEKELLIRVLKKDDFFNDSRNLADKIQASLDEKPSYEIGRLDARMKYLTNLSFAHDGNNVGVYYERGVFRVLVAGGAIVRSGNTILDAVEEAIVAFQGRIGEKIAKLRAGNEEADRLEKILKESE